MKFEIKLSYGIPKDSTSEDYSSTFEMEGDLETVKTYLKLSIRKNFKWGAIQRLDKLVPGDVDRWMIHQNQTTDELSLVIFSFFNVDPIMNINGVIFLCRKSFHIFFALWF